MDKYWHCTLCVKSTWRKLQVGGSVATGLLKISPDFLSKKKQNKTDKETKFKPPNTSKINANTA